jgi:hypothetical protein
VYQQDIMTEDMFSDPTIKLIYARLQRNGLSHHLSQIILVTDEPTYLDETHCPIEYITWYTPFHSSIHVLEIYPFSSIIPTMARPNGTH